MKTRIMASISVTSWQIEREKLEAVTDFIFLSSRITGDDDCSHEIKRHLLLERKTMTNLDSVLKSRVITLLTKVCRRTLESPLDSKEIKLVHPKGNQPWIFIGRTDAEAETPILWPPDAKDWLIWKYPEAGKDWKWEEKRMPEDEMVGWHHWLNGHQYE